MLNVNSDQAGIEAEGQCYNASAVQYKEHVNGDLELLGREESSVVETVNNTSR
jgi:hypothetical protein